MAGASETDGKMKKTFRGKRVFITGHTGFKGSWLTIWLKELEADVLGYSLLPPSEPNNFTASRLSGKVKSVHGDIRDDTLLGRVLRDFQPEFVFHLAAQPIVRLSYERPRDTFETNVMGTVNLLEAVRTTPSVRAAVIVTTDKCYENREWTWGYRENDTLGGHDPYSSSKACTELVSQAYSRSYFTSRKDMGMATARAGNVIGGGDWGADRLLPDCFRAVSKGEKIIIRNPGAVRPWQFVLEPLHGYLLLAQRLRESPGKHAGAWNYGPSSESCIPVRDVVDRIIRYWGGGSWEASSKDPSDDKREMIYLKLNSDKAYSLLGWRGVLPIDAAIKMTVQWYKAFYQSSGIDMYAFCVEQIAQYSNILTGMINHGS